jgi:hypothetical protein
MEFLTIFTIGFTAAVGIILPFTTKRRWKETAALREAGKAVEREVFRAYAVERIIRVEETTDEDGNIIPAHDETVRELADAGVRAALAEFGTK